MAAWSVRASFHAICHPFVGACRLSFGSADESRRRIRRTASRDRRHTQPNAIALRPAGRTEIEAGLSPILLEARSRAILRRATVPSTTLRNAQSGVCRRRPSLVHELRICCGSDTRRLKNGHRCLVSGDLRSRSYRRQRGKPETRQSGGRSVPVDAAPRCRCDCAAGRPGPIQRRETQSLHDDGRIRFLQARGIRTCRP